MEANEVIVAMAQGFSELKTEFGRRFDAMEQWFDAVDQTSWRNA